VPIIGVRGADFLPRNDESPAETTANLSRERRELLFSIAHLRESYRGSRPPIALFHYPPYRLGSCESAFTRILEDIGCRHCVFGHMHTPAEWERVHQGELRGVCYRLVSCDALGFEPLLVESV
jgi:predicted phosphohydrolase